MPGYADCAYPGSHVCGLHENQTGGTSLNDPRFSRVWASLRWRILRLLLNAPVLTCVGFTLTEQGLTSKTDPSDHGLKCAYMRYACPETSVLSVPYPRLRHR